MAQARARVNQLSIVSKMQTSTSGRAGDINAQTLNGPYLRHIFNVLGDIFTIRTPAGFLRDTESSPGEGRPILIQGRTPPRQRRWALFYLTTDSSPGPSGMCGISSDQ